MAGIENETLQFDATGAPYSARYGDVFATRDGALGQARHVFLGGNGLPERWGGRRQFVIVETGFGLGINFLATWQSWRDDSRRPQRLHFVSIERHPLAAEDLLRCAPAPLVPLARELARAWPLPLRGLHRLEFEAGAVVLTLGLGDARSLVPELLLGADAFYLDGFAPSRNPELWDAPLLKALARLARPGATLATWSAARAVREALTQGGFEVSLQAGFGAKRDMLVARFAPRYRTRRHEPPSHYSGVRNAIVVGAGLAGCSTAFALARRGWQVSVIEQGSGVATGASALPAGLLHPALAVDDNHAARLMRAGFLYGRRMLETLPSDAPLMSAHGVLKLVDTHEEERLWPDLLQRQRWPGAFVRWCGVEDAFSLVGRRPRRPGLWFAQAAVVSARSWCRAMLDAPGNIRLQSGRRALRLTRFDGMWQIEDDAEGLHRAPLVVVASAMDAPRLLGSSFAPVRPIRGRITRLAGGALRGLHAGVAGNGYLVPGLDGHAAVGATYEATEDGLPSLPDEAAVASNLQRLAQLLAEPEPVAVDGGFDGVRCVAHDRMPLAGLAAAESETLADLATLRGAQLADLPRRSGLHACFALGSRGLALAPVLGEVIASVAEGEPLPIERSLAASVDPARFLLRRVRTS